MTFKLFTTIAAGLVSCTAMTCPTSAAASTFVFNFGTPAPSGSGDGNKRTFNATDGLAMASVRITGWSLDGTIVRDSFLGQHGSNGLGVQSGDDSQNNAHTIDNHGRTDFLILQFSEAVKLTDGVFKTFKLGNATLNDSDAWIRSGTTALALSAMPLLATDTLTNLSALFSTGANSTTTDLGNNTRNINTAGHVGNIWLIGAARPNTDGRIDSFKFASLSVTTVAPPVPEPATWAMMIAGFGMVGGALRSRRTSRMAAA